MTIHLELPDDLGAPLDRTADAIRADVRLALAIDWLRRGLVTERQAATVSGLSHDRFRDELDAREPDRATIGVRLRRRHGPDRALPVLDT